MSKKYRLIKEYPGSPNLGYEITFKEKFPFVDCHEGKFNLEMCEKHPKFWELIIEKCVLFTTEDGVDIFEGEKYWHIWKDKPAEGQIINHPYYSTAHKLDSSESYSENAVFFSTDKKAEEYVDNNKPLYSIQQILDILDKCTLPLDGAIFGIDLKNQIKSRLCQ